MARCFGESLGNSPGKANLNFATHIDVWEIWERSRETFCLSAILRSRSSRLNTGSVTSRRREAVTLGLAPGAVAGLARDLEQRGLTVDWLVNNAGFGTFGAFHTLPVEHELEEIRLNVEALVEATGREYYVVPVSAGGGVSSLHDVSHDGIHDYRNRRVKSSS